MAPENQQLRETEWWNDANLIRELDKRYAAWEDGKEKGYPLVSIEKAIERLKNIKNRCIKRIDEI